MKKHSRLTSFAALFLAVTMLFVMAACGGKGGNNAEGPGKTAEVPSAGNEPAEGTATPAPTAVVTRAPTKEPDSAPTEAPTPGTQMLDPGTDLYLDFTELGDNAFTSNGACEIERLEEGANMSVVGNDPFATVNVDTEYGTADEYRYVAMKVKASKNDLCGEYRFATTTDGRGWAMVQYQYAKPGEWEIVVFDASTAGYMNPDTLDGEVTMIRIDPYNDGAAVLGDEYYITIESIALFTTEEAARAYKGLYVWPDEAAQGT